MTEGSAPVEIFCCYTNADETWRKKLETHLSLLKRQGLVSFWYDRLIAPGTDWAKALDTHLETASVILLLVSADFLASNYCYGTEMQRALAREAAGEARVVPILVRPMDWTDAPFAHLQILPTDAKPIVSWPNKDTALADVAAGLRRVIAEELPQLTASAPRVALPKIWNIPYPRNPFFLGRDDEFAQVRHHLQTGQATALSQPQAISGLGGIGKTQLALEYAYRYHQDYTAVLWARAESTDALISSYVKLATLLRLPEREAKEQEVTVQAVKIWLQTHRSWLLILDNADDLALLSDFLPLGSAGHLLLTTRAAATGRLAHRLEVETLPPDLGALFLLRRAALLAPNEELSHVSQKERELAMQISQELGGLPLALDQAGAYLEETGCGLPDYQQLYRQHRDELLRKRGGLVADHPESVASTWALSFQQAQEKHPAAAELLYLCAFLAPDAIPEEILTAGASSLGPTLAPVAVDAFLLNQALEALRAYSLIRRNPTGKTLSIHRLVQVVLQATLNEEEQRNWRKRAIRVVNAAFPYAEYETWSQCERLLSQALFITQSLEQDQVRGKAAACLLYKTASYLQDRARYAEAEPLFLRALRIREQQLGPEHLTVASSLQRLAILYRTQGKYAEAEPLFLRALHIREQLSGPEHPDVAYPLDGLATLYCIQGKYAEAEPLYQRALRIREQQLGPEHLTVASSLNGLADLYRWQDKYAEAEPLFLRALRIREQQLGPEHPNVAYPLYGLAELYRRQDKHAEAESLYQRALHIWERQLGPEHLTMASSLNGLGDLYSEQSKHAEAESLYQRALHIWERQLGPEHPNVAYPLKGMASLYRAQGKYGEAELLYQRALRICEQQLGPKHLTMAYPLNGLAILYYEQGKYAEAEPLYQRALHIWEQQWGPEHPDLAYSLNNLANVYREQGKYTEAEPLYQRTLHIREQQLGPEHPKTAETIHDLARFWETQGNREEARGWYARALAIREQTLGAHHPKTTETRKRLIALLHTMEQHEQATQLEVVENEP